MSKSSRTVGMYDLLGGIGNILDGKVEYWDALYDAQSSCVIVKDKVDEQISTPELTGVLIRAFKDGVWFSSSSYDVSKKAISEMANKLIKPTRKPKSPTKLKKQKAQKINKELPVKKDPTKVPLEEKLDNVRKLNKAAAQIDERIINVRTRHTDSQIERVFVNSEGSLMRQVVTRTGILIVPIAREGDKIRADYRSIGRTGGYELVEETDFNDLAQETVMSSLELLGAETPPSGALAVVLDQHMAGLIAHESFGHGLEADQVMRDRSYLKSLVGKKVASDESTIIDSSIVPQGWGSYVFDDEGIPARENVLLEKGVLKGFLHDRLTASTLEAEPTSNCRVESFLAKHFVRMTNTYFAPGDLSLEELLEPVKRGVMLVNSSFGMEDPLGGGIQCTSNKGYMIEKGKLTTPLTEVALAGSVLDLLKNIDGVGNDFKLGPGTCGKGSEDFVPAGDGGGYLRIKKAIVSGG
ncbi:MAG: TldD/PmbA family protein [Candidatus Atabeyarchaeum deiterrae]